MGYAVINLNVSRESPSGSFGQSVSVESSGSFRVSPHSIQSSDLYEVHSLIMQLLAVFISLEVCPWSAEFNNHCLSSDRRFHAAGMGNVLAGCGTSLRWKYIN